MDLPVLIEQCAPAVHPVTMHAIVEQESAGNPYAIGVNDSRARLTQQPATQKEAITVAKALLAEGYNIDMGLGQINSANMDWLDVTVAELFDPCSNLQAAARVLTENYQRALGDHKAGQEALKAALSMYNTGDATSGFSNGYVGEVINHATTVYQVPALTKSPTQQRNLAQQIHTIASSSSAASAEWDVYGDLTATTNQDWKVF